MVTKCILRVAFISLMMAARVVDLPDPVGPVTSTRPLLNPTNRCTALGMRSCSRVRILDLKSCFLFSRVLSSTVIQRTTGAISLS